MSQFLEWATHGVKRGRLEVRSRPTVVLTVIVVGLTLVAAVYLMLVSRTAAQGRRIEQLQTEIFRLQRENEQLTVEIAEVSAMPHLMERAAALGYATPAQVEFLPVSK
jgi:Tfp pilus assembly protein PilN